MMGIRTGCTYNSGCMGLKSVPITLADGNSDAGSVVRRLHSQVDELDELAKIDSPNSCPSSNVKDIVNSTGKIFKRSIV